jgi:hypothetical protein
MLLQCFFNSLKDTCRFYNVGVYPTSDVEGAGVGFISGGRASTFELAFGLRRPKNTNTNPPSHHEGKQSSHQAVQSPN